MGSTTNALRNGTLVSDVSDNIFTLIVNGLQYGSSYVLSSSTLRRFTLAKEKTHRRKEIDLGIGEGMKTGFDVY